MPVYVGYIYERKTMNATTRCYHPKKDPSFGKLVGIQSTVYDDMGRLIGSYFKEVTEDETNEGKENEDCNGEQKV